METVTANKQADWPYRYQPSMACTKLSLSNGTPFEANTLWTMDPSDHQRSDASNVVCPVHLTTSLNM
eukprot:6473608-Amphidinium_carterae.1